jgi:hypothetical protein
VKRARDAEVEPGAGRRRPLEGIFQEIVRRAAAAGFSSFFMTEEAIRQALSENVPKDWVDYVARQSTGMRAEVVDRLVNEFRTWLAHIDTEALSQKLVQLVLEEYEVRLEIRLDARPRDAADPAGVSARLVRK